MTEVVPYIIRVPVENGIEFTPIVSLAEHVLTAYATSNLQVPMSNDVIATTQLLRSYMGAIEGLHLAKMHLDEDYAVERITEKTHTNRLAQLTVELHNKHIELSVVSLHLSLLTRNL